MKFSIITLGCKVNSYESEAIINNLVDHSWDYVLKPTEDCDVLIVNTCTVTSTSDQKSRQMLHQVRRLNPRAVVVAVGCFSQLNPSVASSIADIVLGTGEKLSIYDKVLEYLSKKEKINAITDVLDSPTYEEMKVSRLLTHTRAFIKIQDGCENYCSYCAIPYSRGKIRSRNPNNIIHEVNALVDLGVKEIILAGINTGTYGKDLGDINLAKLIERIMKETQIFRVRISSIELMEISDELLETLVKYQDRIAHHFHIPMQAGVDSVLKRMHRKYLTLDYKNKVKQIRELFPDVAITTDCLAGFVGETEEEFQELLNFIKEVQFYEMHIFPYSRRKNTLADTMDGHLSEDLKKMRAKIMMETQLPYTKAFQEKFIGSDFSVVVEAKKNNLYHGHTTNYLDLYFESSENLTGKVVMVHFEKIEDNLMKGVIINEQL